MTGAPDLPVPPSMPPPPPRLSVLDKLRDCFPDGPSASEALALLDTYGGEPWHRERERVQLAALMQSGGDLDRLRQLVELAREDYRDVLVGAEYPEAFGAPFETPPGEKAAMRERDREQYDAWLQSGGPGPADAADRPGG